MKKLAIFLISLLLTFSTFCQLPDLTPYQKYSYLLITINNTDTIGNGTGFFVHQCNHLYLISNFHILANRYMNGSPFMHKNRPVYWNKLSIRYKKRNSSRWSYFLMDLGHAINFGKSIGKMPYDVFYEEIKGIDPKDVNCVELSAKTLSDEHIKIGSGAFLWGYPVEDYRNARNPDARKPILTSGTLVRYNASTPMDGHNMTFDISVPAKEGSSGAPAFAYYISNKKLIVKFLGIHYGSDGANPAIMRAAQFRWDVIKLLLPPCPK